MSDFNIETIESTSFEFDIEANRRRRAELASDVSELINISKFFIQHYSTDLPDSLPLSKTSRHTSDKIIKNREKNGLYEQKVHSKSNRTPRSSTTKKNIVANVTPTHVQPKQKFTSNETICKFNGIDDDSDVPPLFDKIKLHEYCVDVVEQFFHGSHSNQINEKKIEKEPKRSVDNECEKWVQRTKTVKNQLNAAAKVKRNPKYASISSRYLIQAQLKTANETKQLRTIASNTLVSAKSREILEDIARKGVEIKKHSCLMKNYSLRDTKSEQTISSRSAFLEKYSKSFNEIHPNIELVPSNTIFPRRILKQAGHEDAKLSSISSPQSNRTEGPMTLSDEIKQENVFVENKMEKIDSVQCSNTKIEEYTDIRQTEDISLQLRQLPSLSIQPIIKCKIENIFEIEIKPDERDGMKSDHLQNNNKLLEFVYDSNEKTEENPLEIIAIENTSAHQNSSTEFMNGKHKYSTSLSTSAEQNSSIENNSNDDTQNSSISDNQSLNLSTSSHMTDDEKFRSDRNNVRSNVPDIRRITRNPVKNVIDKILEVEDAEEFIDTDDKCEQINGIQSKYNFEDLREILQKIRDDKTSLELTLETQSNSDEKYKNLSATRRMLDQETQCDNFSNKSHSIDSNCSAMQMNDTKATSTSSPKFHRVIDSIRSSAKSLKCDFDKAEYTTATREQIEKAAKKFLKSILKDSNEENASKSECDDSSSINLRIKKRDYYIVDDRIIQSQMNYIIGKNACNGSSASSGIPSAQMNLADRSYSDTDDFTENSIDVSSYKKFHLNQNAVLHPNPNDSHIYSDMSDGEILSDGEAHIPS